MQKIIIMIYRDTLCSLTAEGMKCQSLTSFYASKVIQGVSGQEVSISNYIESVLN